MMKEVSEFRVRADSNVNNMGAAIGHAFYDDPTAVVEVRAIGAGAVNQAVKAIAVARGMLASRAYEILSRIGFDKVGSNDTKSGEVSVLVFRLHLE